MNDKIYINKNKAKNKLKTKSLVLFNVVIGIVSYKLATFWFLFENSVSDLMVSHTISRIELIDKKIAISFLEYFL